MSNTDTPAPSPSHPVARWKNLLLFCCVLLLIAPISAVLIWRQYHLMKATAEMRALEARLDEKDPGWRTAHLWMDPGLTPATNSANRVIAARQRIPNDRIPQNWRFLPKPTEAPKPDANRQVDAPQPEEPTGILFEELLASVPPNQRMAPDVIRQLTVLLDEFRPAVATALQIADLPRGAFTFDWSDNLVDTKLEGPQYSRDVASLLRYQVLVSLEKRDLERALLGLRAGVNTSRSIGDGPMLVLQLVRMANLQIALKGMERTLGQAQLSGGQLRACQELLQQENLKRGLVHALRGERVIALNSLDRIGEGFNQDSAFYTDDSSKSSPPGRWYLWTVVKPRSISWKAKYLDLISGIVEIAEGSDWIKQRAGWLRFTKHVGQLRSHDPFWMWPAYDAISGIERVFKSATRTVACVESMKTLLALERYRLDHGTWPASLERLVPVYLEVAPIDPFTGKLLGYRIESDHVVVYSVGENKEDEGGKVVPDAPTQDPLDLGYRLWLPEHRAKPAAP